MMHPSNTSDRRLGIAVRPATRDDTALVISLVRELAEYEKLADQVDVTETAMAAALFGPNPSVFCEIVETGGEAAGLAIWFYNFSTFRGQHGIYLEDLFVRPAFRGRGLGKALLQSLAQRCVREDLPRMDWSVLDWNTPSIAFYKAQGAVLLDDWTTCRLTGDALTAFGQGI